MWLFFFQLHAILKKKLKQSQNYGDTIQITVFKNLLRVKLLACNPITPEYFSFLTNKGILLYNHSITIKIRKLTLYYYC